MRKTLHMKERSDMKSCGLSFKSVTSVSTSLRVRSCYWVWARSERRTGSRYIYDLYYEKEAMSKPLYDYLLKNGYADGTLIAKWKKQGYEKVWAIRPPRCAGNVEARNILTVALSCNSCVVSDVFKPKRPTSMQLASVEFPRRSSRRIRQSSV